MLPSRLSSPRSQALESISRSCPELAVIVHQGTSRGVHDILHLQRLFPCAAEVHLEHVCLCDIGTEELSLSLSDLDVDSASPPNEGDPAAGENFFASALLWPVLRLRDFGMPLSAATVRVFSAVLKAQPRLLRVSILGICRSLPPPYAPRSGGGGEPSALKIQTAVDAFFALLESHPGLQTLRIATEPDHSADVIRPRWLPSREVGRFLPKTTRAATLVLSADTTGAPVTEQHLAAWRRLASWPNLQRVKVDIFGNSLRRCAAIDVLRSGVVSRLRSFEVAQANLSDEPPPLLLEVLVNGSLRRLAIGVAALAPSSDGAGPGGGGGGGGGGDNAAWRLQAGVGVSVMELCGAAIAGGRGRGGGLRSSGSAAEVGVGGAAAAAGPGSTPSAVSSVVFTGLGPLDKCLGTVRAASLVARGERAGVDIVSMGDPDPAADTLAGVGATIVGGGGRRRRPRGSGGGGADDGGSCCFGTTFADLVD